MKSKGGKDSLIITSKAVYIVDVKNDKIVTAMDKKNMSENEAISLAIDVLSKTEKKEGIIEIAIIKEKFRKLKEEEIKKFLK